MSPKMSSISIVMATYNGENFIAEQLESIVNQTIAPLEVIIRDDCSTDNTIAIIETYWSKLPIRLERSAENVGYIKNFELALSLAMGEYIVFCDQDDIWETQKLERLMEGLNGYSLAYCNSSLVDSNGKSLRKTLKEKLKNNFISTHSPLAFVYDNCVSAHAMIFHRSLVQQLIPFPKHLFFDAWIAANAASVNGVHYIDLPLIRYRQHSSNTVSGSNKVKSSFIKKIALKAENKLKDHHNFACIISDMLQMSSLSAKDRDVLQKLQEGHLSFGKCWFNVSMYRTLVENEGIIFAITKKKSKKAAFKKAVGYKLYRIGYQ
jgi:glycosyltransferase involved in cell wall biosynthesis